MKINTKVLSLFGYVVLVSALTVMPVMAVQETEPADSDSWGVAGKEIQEAGHAVGDATKETWEDTKDASARAWEKTKDASGEAWDATKEASGEAWDATKEKSRSAWEKGKAKLHEATAPDPEIPAPVENFSEAPAE